MPAPMFSELLDQVRDNPANHNRWKALTDYPNKNTAKVTATKLRNRYGHLGYDFKVVAAGPRWAVGVFYKQTGPDGRTPAAEAQEAP